MKYLKAEEILIIHSEIIDQTGGTHGVRDVGLLASIAEKPRATFGGRDLYTGVLHKSAVLMEALVQYHVFIDGNKRTGVVVCARFLFINGYELTATNEEVENFVVRVAVEKLGLDEIVSWLEERSKKI
jgi:death-on-curing protein